MRLVPLVLSLALGCPLGTQAAIRIVQVPERLVLPAAPGSNLVLEVEVSGSPRAVWLGTDTGSARVALTEAALGRFQCNLGAPEVDKLVRAAPADALRVFAEGDGPRRSSAAIVFQRAEARPQSLRCQARLAQATAPATLTTSRPAWLDPAQVERLDVEGAAPDTVLVAHMGTTDCPLARVGERGQWRLTLDDGKRQAWQAAGQLDLVAQRGTETEPAFTILAVPARLEVPAAGAEFAIVQRRSEPVPGSRGWLRVKIDDITAGQVLLEVTSADGRTIVPRRSVQSRDRIELPLAGGAWVLVVRRLVNHLIGDDFAELAVVPAAGLRPDPIAGLLQRIAAADVVFVREGKDYDGAAAAVHLRAKLDALDREVTLDEFVDQIASKSSTTGNPYQVRTADGKTMPMRDWLRKELARSAAEAGRQPVRDR